MVSAVTARDQLRASFFKTLRRAFATSDGREIAADALSGLLAWRPPVPAIDAPLPYDDLGPSGQETSRTFRGTVFITARFRTGSTLVWNLFRHVDGCVSYYEPLNERRWFDPHARGDRLDPTHRDVEDYWREYEGLSDLGAWHREDWTDRALLLTESAWDPGLRQYFARLIDHASPKRAVLQCNRIDFRLPWLRRQFPGATLVHLYRHPRDQWCSALVKPAEVPRDITMDRFEPHDHFYLRRWALDLQHHFPFLSPRVEPSPYRIFYYIWRLSYLFGAGYADHSLAFERLLASPAEEITKLMAVAGIDADLDRLVPLVSQAPVGRWRQFADDSWFREQESACETVLTAFFQGQAAPADRSSAG